ncbi:MAG: preprotein translocase subunit SecE [Myxococcaceae bacterium]|nr:preprotein translocase subunit SecE [Myxococcaceae bacterium]
MASGTEASEQANRAGMDPLRLVVIFLLLAGIVLGLFLEKLFGLLLTALNVGDAVLIEGLDWRVSTALGFALAAALALSVYFRPRTRALASEVAGELMKVTWPSWLETRTSTMAVVVASVIAAVILFAIDNIALRLMVEWLPAVWARL